MMFGSNPLGMTVLGEPEVISSVKRQDFVDYHMSQYTPKNMVVVLAGKIDQAQVMAKIQEWFGGVEGEAQKYFEKVVWKQDKPKVYIKTKDLAQQAHIELAVKGVTMDDPRRFSLGVLTSYLGSGLSSRLFIELREKRGLCYSVHASDEKYPDVGVWGVYAGLNVAKLEEAVIAILGEVKRLKTYKLTQEEVDAAREKLRGPLLFSMENPINQMNFYAKQALDKPEDILTYEEIEKELMKVTPETIQKAAQDILLTQSLNLAVVGPVGQDKAEKLLQLLSLD
jgi:predicted Zn-dependent peptidase